MIIHAVDSLHSDARRLKEVLRPLPEAVVSPPFIVVSGLPGTGKSHFARNLKERVPAVIVESDALRKTLFARPVYTRVESSYLFNVCYVLLEELLRKGIPVIFDATNLSERHREQLYRIADITGAKFILVRVEAPPALVEQRLEERQLSSERQDSSDADWQVYLKMKQGVERIQHRHYAVDTSRDIDLVIKKIVRELRK